jgi:hypothetical protein
MSVFKTSGLQSTARLFARRVCRRGEQAPGPPGEGHYNTYMVPLNFARIVDMQRVAIFKNHVPNEGKVYNPGIFII